MLNINNNCCFLTPDVVFSCCRRICQGMPRCSNKSLVTAMQRFVRAVGEMEETILVPCRLKDLTIGDCEDDMLKMNNNNNTCSSMHLHRRGSINVPPVNTDLFTLYSTVNTVKKDLLWGSEIEETSTTTATTTATTPVVSATTLGTKKGHVRRPSNVSTASTISDSSDSEAGNENDSGIETEDTRASAELDYAMQVEKEFRKNLNGLYRSLRDMTVTANYLTQRYQKDVGGGV